MTLIIILYALFAVSVSAGKALLHYSQPIFLMGCRMFFAGIILLCYQYFYAFESFKIRKKDLWLYAQVALIGFYTTYILRFWGLNYLSASKSMFLYNLSPFVTSLYSYVIFSEKITPIKWLGLLIGFIGFIPILYTSSPLESYVGEYFFISWPELAIIASVFSNSYSWIVIKTLVRNRHYSPMMINALTMTSSGLLGLLTSYFVEGPFPVSSTYSFLTLLFFIIIISNIICHNLYGFLLKTYSATFLSFAGFTGPLFAALYSWILLNETITWHFYVSSVIVFIGLYLFYKDELSDINSMPSEYQS
ncbi:MAG: DMT family transporter [Candidatus Babeliales bacterium]